MPINSQIIRDGQTLPVRWSQFHIAAMAIAIMFEEPEKWDGAKPNDDIIELYPGSPQPIGPRDTFMIVTYPVLAAVWDDRDEVTLEHAHAFEDVSDGEVFKLNKGDKLRIWRD